MPVQRNKTEDDITAEVLQRFSGTPSAELATARRRAFVSASPSVSLTDGPRSNGWTSTAPGWPRHLSLSSSMVAPGAAAARRISRSRPRCSSPPGLIMSCPTLGAGCRRQPYGARRSGLPRRRLGLRQCGASQHRPEPTLCRWPILGRESRRGCTDVHKVGRPRHPSSVSYSMKPTQRHLPRRRRF